MKSSHGSGSATGHEVGEITVDGKTCPTLEAPSDRKNLCVFVHGFGGSPLGTWEDVYLDMLGHNAWMATDAVFFNYDSFRESATSAASKLRQLIESLFPVNSVWGGEYENLILVGHSLGGVVIRRCITFNERSTSPVQGLRDARLRLLSPAIGGVRLAGWKALIKELPIISTLLSIPLKSTPAFTELQPESRLLGDLARHTERFADQLPGQACFRANIAWAVDENVVLETEYFFDTLEASIAGSHTTMKSRVVEIRSLVLSL